MNRHGGKCFKAKLLALEITIEVPTVSRFPSCNFSIKISFLFVKWGVDGVCFRGELRFHVKIEGTSSFKDTTCVKVVLKSSALQYLEQTLALPKSLLIAWIHCSGFLRLEIGSKIFWHQLLRLDKSSYTEEHSNVLACLNSYPQGKTSYEVSKLQNFHKWQ